VVHYASALDLHKNRDEDDSLTGGNRPFQSADRHERERERQKPIVYQRDIRKILIGKKIGNFCHKIDKMLYFINAFLC